MSDKKVVLFNGMFHEVDADADVDVSKLTNGVAGSDIQQLGGASTQATAYQDEGNIDLSGKTPEEQIKAIVMSGYEQEDTNTNSIGTVAWLKAELDAMDVEYEPNSKLAQLQELFINNAVAPTLAGDAGSRNSED